MGREAPLPYLQLTAGSHNIVQKSRYIQWHFLGLSLGLCNIRLSREESLASYSQSGCQCDGSGMQYVLWEGNMQGGKASHIRSYYGRHSRTSVLFHGASFLLNPFLCRERESCWAQINFTNTGPFCPPCPLVLP